MIAALERSVGVKISTGELKPVLGVVSKLLVSNYAHAPLDNARLHTARTELWLNSLQCPRWDHYNEKSLAWHGTAIPFSDNASEHYDRIMLRSVQAEYNLINKYPMYTPY